MIYGLTGGTGSGKSTVANYLREFGYAVVDADIIARSVTAKGSPVLDELAAEFGADIIDENSELIRKKLGSIVFGDKEKLEKLMAESAGAVTLSFEELLYEDNFDIMESGDTADKALYDEELRNMIASAIEELSPKARQVVTLYYYEKIKFGEIARVLGITESIVCQIHSKAMLFLKHKLEDYVRKD